MPDAMLQQLAVNESMHQVVPARTAVHEIEWMIDVLARTGQMPHGLLDALTRVNDPDALERLAEKLQAVGGQAAADHALEDVMKHYRPGEDPYDLFWPLPPNLLPSPFEALDRETQFHVLFAECRRRLAEGAELRCAGKLDQADAAFNECLARADQIDVALLKSEAYHGLATVSELRGSRAAAKRYMQLAQRERTRGWPGDPPS